MSKINQINGGVIWITGYSASGKTSVGREVQQILLNKNLPVIFLDGDDLRSIYKDKWGYTNEERLELSMVHLRLCSHLSKQGYIVILAAVAMYKEARNWAKDNISNLLYVMLDVSLEERIERDRHTKQVYSSIDKNQLKYDLELEPDLIINNSGNNATEKSANNIVNDYLVRDFDKPDYGRSIYWDEFYSNKVPIKNESAFATEINASIKPSSSILVIGSGDGADSIYFAKHSHSVTAIDPSLNAIHQSNQRIINKPLDNLSFFNYEIVDLLNHFPSKQFDVIYCYNSLNNMTLYEEQIMLQLAFLMLKDGGNIFIQCLSINHSLSRTGDIISANERAIGHYKRFINLKELTNNIHKSKLYLQNISEHSHSNPSSVSNNIISVVAAKED
jgi:adenylylsulfate kinase-like enzyme/ubiquinone/menaquinone biosynthesis C-methylase UbiE